MFRKTALASALVGILATGNALALGLGEIETKSLLNQPFNAEVPLLSATDEELSEMKVELATREAFSRAGIDRTLFLTRLNFSVGRNDAGQPMILMTSQDAVNEPFLDFLIEVSWSRGRLLREYTVLIDPPVTMPAAPVVTQPPVVTASEPPASRIVNRTTPVVEPAAPTVPQDQQPTSVASPKEYGPTRRNDTLWRIADYVRPDEGVSVEQTMLAILRENPDAFVDNNINNLKTGYVLRIPDREQITQLSRSEASREAQSQYRTWRAARAAAGATQAQASEAGGEVANTDKPSLQLLAPDAEQAGTGTGGVADSSEINALRRELVLANEALEAQRLEAAESNSRVLVLEEQIQNMKRLIDLKDSELARLQAQFGESETQEAGSDAPVSAEIAEDTAVVAADTGDAVTSDTEMLQEAPMSPVSPIDTSVAEQATVGAEEVEPVAAVQPEPASEPALPVEASETFGDRAETFFQTLLARVTGNPVWVGVGVALLILLTVFGLRRRRQTEDSDFQESILRSPQDEDRIDEPSVTEFAQPASEMAALSRSSLLSEFAVSDMTAAGGEGASDPLAEADVYLAYGRYQQAEDLVREALENRPDHEELNLKLLEIYQAAGQTEQFDQHAQTILEHLGDREHPFWKRVSEMGLSVNPANSVYALDGGVPETVGESEPVSMAEVAATTASHADDAFDTAEPGEFVPPQHMADEQEAAGEVSDVLESFDSASTDELTAPQETGETVDNSLEFDLDGFDLGAGEVEDSETGDGELADMDEVSTKLDLARAYIDMGDSDGARSILDEVIEEGTEEQKNEALGILQRLAS
jgi:pilus assembly protein FimV